MDKKNFVIAITGLTLALLTREYFNLISDFTTLKSELDSKQEMFDRAAQFAYDLEFQEIIENNFDQ